MIEKLKVYLNRNFILRTIAEIQSNHDRVRWAEGLILQLPDSHDGRNSWLLNYGKREEAVTLRQKRGLNFNNDTQSAETTGVKS